MAKAQLTLLLDAPATSSLANILINPYCRRGHNVNRSCCQCLKRTIEQWGYDAETYDASALRETAKPRSKAHRQRGYTKWAKDQADKTRQIKYGITPKEYKERLEAQNYVCALCSQPETQQRKGTVISLAVDHDHDSGTIRGLLCARCNKSLGHIEKLDLAWILRAQNYLLTAESWAMPLVAPAPSTPPEEMSMPEPSQEPIALSILMAMLLLYPQSKKSLRQQRLDFAQRVALGAH